MNGLRLGALLLLSCAHAEPSGHAVQPERLLSPEQIVRATIAPTPAVPSGGHGELRITLQIAPGYHVMSNQPSNPLYIASRVRFAAHEIIAWGAPIYPPPQSFRLADETIATFEGEIAVRVPFEIANAAIPGSYELLGTLEYQSCTQTSCLFPVKRTLTAPITIVRP